MKRYHVGTLVILLGVLLSQGASNRLDVANARPGVLADSFVFCGPANNYCEDNDTPATVFGPQESGTAIQAYPDDTEDYYYFEISSPGEVVGVSLGGFAPTSSNGSILLYGPADGDELGDPIDYYGPTGHSSMFLGPHGLGPGKYFVRVYTTGDHSITQLYTLTVTAESQRDFLPLLLLNYPPNEPPHIPSSPAPADGATDVTVKVNLNWVGGDPEGDSVTYDVYLEADDNVPTNLVCDGVTSTFCDPGVLNSGTHYYWKVVATDENGLITMGPVWHFTTQEIINRLVRWRSADGAFNDWGLNGVRIAADGTLELDVATASDDESDPPGGYGGRNFYNGGTYWVGEAIGPLVETPVTFTEAIASWNAHTPPGTWIETQIRAQLGDRWSKWYNLGVWAADASAVERHSVAQQGDADGYVAVDTLVVTNDTEPLRSYQLKLRLFSENGAAVPTVRNASVALSEPPASPDALVPGRPEQWDSVLSVPECSQMVYLDGGEVWCSPTSTSMVLAYWNQDTGPCEPRVRAAVAGVYDWLYNGHGNWPFNTAYAATHGLEGYVARFTSLAQAEEWIAAGVPVIVSIAWGPGELTGAPLPYSNGHLLVLVGFDADGDPVVNDPAGSSDNEVRRTYIRDQFESLWLKHTSGTAYLIYPPRWSVPDF